MHKYTRACVRAHGCYTYVRGCAWVRVCACVCTCVHALCHVYFITIINIIIIVCYYNYYYFNKQFKNMCIHADPSAHYLPYYLHVLTYLYTYFPKIFSLYHYNHYSTSAITISIIIVIIIISVIIIIIIKQQHAAN